MRLRITKCKNTDIFYVIKTVYVNGKQKTKTVERIGNTNEVKQKSNGEDHINPDGSITTIDGTFSSIEDYFEWFDKTMAN